MPSWYDASRPVHKHFWRIKGRVPKTSGGSYWFRCDTCGYQCRRTVERFWGKEV